MTESEFKRIKQKIKKIDAVRWWGDDFDVRFYLVSKVKRIHHQTILDVGGGIGIISSELNSNNFRINIDLSFSDLLTCKNKVDRNIETICASMSNLPFVEGTFDSVICANILEVAKSQDIKMNNVKITNSVKIFPMVNNVLSNLNNVLKNNGLLYITTPNNAYFQGNKMSYYELKYALNHIFLNYKIYFYNTFKKLSKTNRKLNFANIFPKIMGKIMDDQSIMKKLLKKDEGNDKYSVWFYVEATKSIN